MMLLDPNHELKSVSANHVFDYVSEFKDAKDEKMAVAKKVEEAMAYLDEAIDIKDKLLLKKVNFPSLLITALKAKDADVHPLEFADWMEEFKKALPEPKTETKVDSNVASLPDKSTDSTNPVNVAPSLDATPTPKELAKPDTQSACNWNSVEEEVQPNSPIKAGEYVHVVAQQASTVCIMDGQKRVATLNLQVGEGRSIYGLSPFRVYSADFKEVKVYFQGQQIKLAKQDTQQIKLTAATYMPLKN
jgi:hypothetical protein